MTDYQLLAGQIASMNEGCAKPLPVLANAAALLWMSLDRINWAGFYLMSGDELVLGPFQGKPACTVIRMGRGVCGTAAQSRETQRVADVHAFPGHIACDSASASEIVIPLILPDGRLIGVLDIDSPVKDRFSPEDQKGLEAFAQALCETADWNHGWI